MHGAKSKINSYAKSHFNRKQLQEQVAELARKSRIMIVI